MARSHLLALALVAGCGLDIVGSELPTVTSSNDGGVVDAGVDSPAAQQPEAGAADVVVSKEPLCPSTPDLLGCFAFNGTATDDSPRKVVLVADNLTFLEGREDQSVRFTLTPKSNVRFPFNAALNTPRATIEMFFRVASLPASGRSILIDMAGRFGVILEADGEILCRSIKAVTKVTIGAWIHLACVNDGTTMTTYVNGVNEASAANVLGTTSDFVGVGQDSPGGGDAFDGEMDNLRFWSEARTAAQVALAAAR